MDYIRAGRKKEKKIDEKKIRKKLSIIISYGKRNDERRFIDNINMNINIRNTYIFF